MPHRKQSGSGVKHGVVAAGHPLVADTCCEVLAAGGNAFDAALAGMAMACVAESVLASLGGGTFLLAAPAGEPARVYDAFVQTPARHPPAPGDADFCPVDIRFGAEVQTFHVGWGTVAVPGVVAGLFAAHRDLGRMPMRDILAPAARAAAEGVSVNATQANYLQLIKPVVMTTEASRALYGSARNPGDVLGEGEQHRQPELADTLETLGVEGPELFYRGEIAAALLAAAGEGGVLAASDLEHYAVNRHPPLTLDFNDARIETNPPPASGGLLVAFGLALLEGSGIGGLPLKEDAHATLIAATLDATGAARMAAAAEGGGGDALPEARLLARDFLQIWREQVQALAPARRGTTQITVADAVGNLASLTTSNGSNSGCVIPNTGVAVNNMLGEADLNPAGFHRWPVATRLTSMMAPSLVRWPDGRAAATGSGGSNRIRSAVLQVLVNLVAHEMDVAGAVEAPRLHVDEGRLSVECGFDPDVLAGTLKRWPDHCVWERPSMFFGGAHTVAVGRGMAAAHGDSRRGGVARKC